MSVVSTKRTPRNLGPIRKAVRLLDGQANLAAAISRPKAIVSDRQVSHWVTGVRPVPSKHCIAIEQATGGRVTRYQLCPLVFGSAPPESVAA